ncbi:urease accessory protein UreE [Telmatospirillum sp. J64-1]|uniref:urease accessory protein UreE n=1 Tax=Telmatospirillum sp. J64-1 TaxID=2502183 RepID=UPI00115E2058|nr:urease accessory protein UreE [Telmatospirillum sp. J64-1]
MLRAVSHHPAGHWPQAEQRATVTLAYEDRHKRRVLMVDDAGAEFLLDLPHATQLSDGDGLGLESGGFIAVRAAVEDVIEVHCHGAEQLARIAWHIGNRHMPVQVLAGGRLRLPDDHVLVHMLEGLGAHVESLRAPFQPEKGAYAGEGHSHAHSHGAHSHEPHSHEH